MDGPAVERALRDHAAAVETWLDEAHQQGVPLVVLSGGEPTLSPHLLPLLERLFAGRSVLDLDTGRPVAVLGLGLRATLPLLVAAFAFAAVGALAEISAMLVLVHTPPLPFTQTVYMALQGDAPALDWAVPGVLLTLIIVGLIATAVVLVRARRRLHSGVEQPFRLPAEWQRGSA